MRDDELAHLVKEVLNNKDKFELLYSKIINKVYYWCYIIVGNEADAQDATQESIIRIYKKMDMAKDLDKFNAWMHKVVTNCCYNYLRKRKRKDLSFVDTDNFSENFESKIPEVRSDVLPKESYDLQETKRLISKFVSNLPRKQREAVILFYFEEFKVDEIARILDCNSNSVKARLHNGRKNLEKQISEYQEENNTKLYNYLSLPILLKVSLNTHRKEINAKQNHVYNPNFNTLVQPYSLLQNILSVLSFKTLFLSTLVCSLVIVSIYILQNDTNFSNDSIQKPLGDLVWNPHKYGYQWMSEISYDKNLTRYSIPITIALDSSIKEKDVSIYFDKKEIAFTYKNSEIVFQANQNGIYKIQAKDETVDIKIDTIDEHAPQLKTVYNHKQYIQLVIDDIYQEVNYQKSYIEYKGKKYFLSKDNIINGEFEGDIIVVLFNINNQFVQYDVKLN
ncbi:MAG: RNA polymerase sigma factor [Coprobacillaceae bacterium]